MLYIKAVAYIYTKEGGNPTLYSTVYVAVVWEVMTFAMYHLIQAMTTHIYYTYKYMYTTSYYVKLLQLQVLYIIESRMLSLPLWYIHTHTLIKIMYPRLFS